MEKWFSKFGTLLKVDAAQSEETTYYEVEHILESTLAKVGGAAGGIRASWVLNLGKIWWPNGKL